MPPTLTFTREEVEATWRGRKFNQLSEDARVELMSAMDPAFASMDRLNRRRVAARFGNEFLGQPALDRRPASEDMAAAEALAVPRFAPPQYGGLGQPPMPPPTSNPMAQPSQPTQPVPTPPRQASSPIPPSKPASLPRTVARPGPSVTIISPAEEFEFRQWVGDNKIPFDPGPDSDYDMRGYWQAMKRRDPRAQTELSSADGRPHFPDTWKTPKHKTFSNESIYAGPDASKWVGKQLIDSYGNIVVDEGAEDEARKKADSQEKERQFVINSLGKLDRQKESSALKLERIEGSILLKMQRSADDAKLKLEQKAADEKRKLEQKTFDLAAKKPEATANIIGMEKLGGAAPGVRMPTPSLPEVNAPSLLGDMRGGAVRGVAGVAFGLPQAAARIPGGFQDQLMAQRPVGRAAANIKRDLAGVAKRPFSTNIEDNLPPLPMTDFLEPMAEGDEFIGGQGRLQETARGRKRYQSIVDRTEQDMLPAPPLTVPGRLSEALGSMVAFMIPGGVLGRAATYWLGAGVGVADAMARADRSGIPLGDDQRTMIGAAGTALGLAEGLPIERLLGGLKKAKVIAQGADEANIIKELFPNWKDYGKSAAKQFLREGGQEFGTAGGANVLEWAYGGRQKDQIGEGLIDSFTYGGSAGAILDVMMKFAGVRAGRSRLREIGVDPEALRDFSADLAMREQTRKNEEKREQAPPTADASTPPTKRRDDDDDGPGWPRQSPTAAASTPPTKPNFNPMAQPRKPQPPTMEELTPEMEELLAAQEDAEPQVDEYQRAIEIANAKGRVSSRILQNELVIPAADAEALAARLEAEGIVDPADESGVRWLKEVEAPVKESLTTPPAQPVQNLQELPAAPPEPQKEVIPPADAAPAAEVSYVETESVSPSGKPKQTILAKNSDGVIFGEINLLDDGDGYRVDSTSIDKPYRGQGLGKALYRRAIDAAKDRGKKYIESAHSVSESAAMVWESLGAEKLSGGPSTRYRITFEPTGQTPQPAIERFHEAYKKLTGDDNHGQTITLADVQKELGITDRAEFVKLLDELNQSDGNAADGAKMSLPASTGTKNPMAGRVFQSGDVSFYGIRFKKPIAPVGENKAIRPGEKIVRFDRVGLDLSKDAVSRPHGAYFTLGDNSPHEGETKRDGEEEERYDAIPTPKNPLVASPVKINHRRFGRLGPLDASGGVAALKALLPDEFERLRVASKQDLVDELGKRYPGPDYSKYYDSYELLEAFAGMEARRRGYDAIVYRKPPGEGGKNFSEYIALTPDTFQVVPPKGLKFTGPAPRDIRKPQQESNVPIPSEGPPSPGPVETAPVAPVKSLVVPSQPSSPAAVESSRETTFNEVYAQSVKDANDNHESAYPSRQARADYATLLEKGEVSIPDPHGTGRTSKIVLKQRIEGRGAKKKTVSSYEVTDRDGNQYSFDVRDQDVASAAADAMSRAVRINGLKIRVALRSGGDYTTQQDRRNAADEALKEAFGDRLLPALSITANLPDNPTLADAMNALGDSLPGNLGDVEMIRDKEGQDRRLKVYEDEMNKVAEIIGTDHPRVTSLRNQIERHRKIGAERDANKAEADKEQAARDAKDKKLKDEWQAAYDAKLNSLEPLDISNLKLTQGETDALRGVTIGLERSAVSYKTSDATDTALRARGWLSTDSGALTTDGERAVMAVHKADEINLSGRPMSEYKPGNKRVPDPGVSGVSFDKPIQFKGDNWHTDGHFAAMGNPPGYWKATSTEAANPPDLARVLPTKEGKPITPVGFQINLDTRDGADRQIYFSHGGRIKATTYDHVVKLHAPDKWAANGKNSAVEAYKNGKLVAVIMPLRMDEKAEIPVNIKALIVAASIGDLEAAYKKSKAALKSANAEMHEALRKHGIANNARMENGTYANIAAASAAWDEYQAAADRLIAASDDDKAAHDALRKAEFEARRVTPQPDVKKNILNQETTDAPIAEPDGTLPVDGIRPSDRKALEGAPPEDESGVKEEGAVPQQRVGSPGVNRGSIRGVGQQPRPEPRPGEGDSVPGVGVSTERTGQPDDRIRAGIPDGTSTERDHRIHDGDGIGVGGLKEKARLNLEAIRLLKKLESENREATPAEKLQLARYVGWGGMSQAFDAYNRDWKGVYEELKEVLTAQEFAAARASTPNAHYTAPAVINGIWNAIERLGLGKNASVLEPAMGVGHFFGLQPDSLLPARRTGIELDLITGRIAKALYPDASVHVAGFEKVKMPNNFFDLAIGNVPFGDYGVYDPEFKGKPSLTARIHDYFFVKALKKVRPGGVVVFITSHHTMDKVNSSIRKHLSEHADLIGAIRLPDTTFKANAGTEVTTDIIFLQKRADGQPAGHESWLGLESVATEDGRETKVNEYFSRHPEMMLGKMALTGRMYASETPTLTGTFTPESMEAAVAKLPQDIIPPYDRPTASRPAGTPISQIPEAGTIKDYGYAIIDGKLVQRIGDVVNPARLPANDEAIVRKLIPIRDAARTVLHVQLDNKTDADLKQAQDNLNALYDAFVKRHGPVSSQENVKAYRDDPDLPLILSLEDYNAEKNTATKAAIFSERTVGRYTPVVSVETAAEALAVSLNEYGRLDWARMQELTGRDPDQLRAELGVLVYQNPDGRQWEMADSYLSGNVREKLLEAEAATLSDPAYSRNVEVLKAVQPVDIPPWEISIGLGSPWVPTEVVKEFASKILKTNFDIGHSVEIGVWTVSKGKHWDGSVENTTEYGTSYYSGGELLAMALNGQLPKVYKKIYVDGVIKSVVDEKETVVAQEKQQSLSSQFPAWVWSDKGRATVLARKYNDELNNIRLETHDGSHLTFPGMAQIILRQHQKNVVWRIIKAGNTLMAHVVGSGKTFAIAAAAMELKRLGIAKKSVIVVPNHLVEQWGAEFIRLYPGANVFVAGKDVFDKGNRQRAMARIATGNYDAIIMAHNSFGKLPVSNETFNKYVQEQIDELIAAAADATRTEGAKGKTVKELEKAIRRLVTKIEKRAALKRRDNAMTFEELGVDQIFVDEAHLFKNLSFATKMTRIAGLPNTESGRSFDMFMKTQYLMSKSKGRGVVFATGTPVTNSMAELYTMQRYLQMQYLKDSGLHAFDSWAANFGNMVTGLELAPEGTGYRINTRFAKFVNIPELMTGFRMVADVQTAAMLKLPVPKLETGSVQPVTALESKENKAIVTALAARASNIRSGKVDSTIDNMVKVTTEGRLAALDIRVLNPNAPDNPGSKVNLAVDKIYTIWEDTKKDSLAQVVFMDLSVPKSKGRSGFSAYQDMKQKLIKRGIPEKEVAFIHDAESEADKLLLFRSVNAGRVRVIFGSTEKLGAGTNMQRKLVALHHMDAPWRPADIEQREGRILRQGNENAEVKIFQYLTQGSFDAYMWQLLGSKAGFISAVLSGDISVRNAEDVSPIVLSAEEFMAVVAGSPEVKEKVGVDAELRKLVIVRTDYARQQSKMAVDLSTAPREIADAKRWVESIRADIALRDANPGGLAIGETKFSGDEARKNFIEALDKLIRSFTSNDGGMKLGTYRGFALFTDESMASHGFPGLLIRRPSGGTHSVHFNDSSPVGTVQSLESILRSFENNLNSALERVEAGEQKLEALKAKIGKPFEKEDRYNQLLKRQKELGDLLNINSHAANAAGMPDAIADTEDTATEENAEDEEDEDGNPMAKPRGVSKKRLDSEMGFLSLDLLAAPFQALGRRLRFNPTQKTQPEYFKWGSEATEKRFQDGGRRQDEPQGIFNKLSEAAADFTSVFRTYRPLSRKIYGGLYAELTKAKAARGMASNEALLSMTRQVAGMTPPEYELFRKAVIADDMLETMELFSEQGKEIPEKLAFGWTPETLRSDHARVTKAVSESPRVKKAMENRSRIWAEIKAEYIPAMKAAGANVEGKMDRQNYYRHKVLLQKRLESIAAQEMKVPKQRGFLKRRDVENIGMDYATNFIETEIEVMTQLMIDTQMAKFVAYLDKNYNTMDQVKEAARWQNVQTVMPYFEEMAETMNAERGPQSETEYTGSDMFRGTLNKKQAMAIDALGKLASQGQLPDTPNGRWADTIEGLANQYFVRQAAKAAGVEYPAGEAEGDLLGYAAWVLNRKEASSASNPAAQLFKGIKEKADTIKRLAGDKFVTWEKMIPEGYREYAIDPTKAFYTVFTIPEHLAMEIMEKSAVKVGISEDDIRKVFAQGAAHDPMILPDAVVDQFELMAANLGAARKRNGILSRAVSAASGIWKQYQLHSPFRFIAYLFRNQSGDGDSMVAGLPWGRTVKHLRKHFITYSKEINAYFGPILRGNLQDAVMSPELKMFAAHGAFQQLLSSYETGQTDIIKGSVLEELIRWDRKEPRPSFVRRNNPAALYSGLMRKAAITNDWREAMNRYVVYRIILEDINENDGNPTSYSASLKEQIDQLKTADGKAYQMSNDLMGAYDELSVAGTQVRKWLIPFWAFQETNIRRYAHIIRNGIREGATAQKIGQVAIGATLRAPYLAYKVGETYVKMFAVWALFNAFNMLHDEEDDQLRKDVRQRPHLTFGATSDKKEVVHFTRLGNIADLAEWFDIEESKVQFEAAFNGHKSFPEAMWEAFRGGPMEKLLLSASPQLKYIAEAGTGKTYFPSIDRPRVIEDWGEKLAQDLVLGDLYRAAAGKPMKKMSPFERASKLFVYRSDAKESAYYDIQEAERKWLNANGEPPNEFSSKKLKSTVMRNIKRSLRVEDQVATKKYLKEYIALGGDAASFKNSIKYMHPLHGLRVKARANEDSAPQDRFIKSLSAEDKSRLGLAIEYYNETFLGEFADKHIRAYLP